ncbi:helix-turn-helix domain-containing protein [Pseudomonas aeruginosa]|uniref:helix-turn-helix domain-containing protein n=1 Tax=Pseudomonas aeruginosa group TaxID=136841 RepID=UPI000FF3E40E|nr:helix-turn-helix domain-containing protein [Pseudomonas aeruginosa]QWY05837.1 helix-turn-helix domain-containing protein [Pseudomonas aeruginosa]RWY21993.1 helix-turn-helix domain-containing protein [Pseudomonas aeruginosa]HBN7763511.1 helix-turn-helix domain-containing protein [Pseudomonas aeruginosa]HEJ1456456.1 helix-turn-helix domain-containing protein [Pseudomonas aeruginosa]HEK0003294.1 helix-turn-helix domain-containing protein [Pseudomonas aeruginosa]
MSTVLMSQCWPIQGLSCAQKAVLISLADNANDQGVCWPAVATIAERTCLSERAVRNAIRMLEDSRIVECHQRTGRSTYYVLTPAAYAPGSSCTPAPDAPHPGISCTPPRHDVQGTPAPGAPITVREPSENQKRTKSDARGARLPDDWSLTQEWLDWALADRPEFTEQSVRRIAESFADYWHAATGQNSRKADWFATWRNWFRKERAPAGNVHHLPSRHHGFADRDYTAGLIEREDGTYGF